MSTISFQILRTRAFYGLSATSLFVESTRTVRINLHWNNHWNNEVSTDPQIFTTTGRIVFTDPQISRNCEASYRRVEREHQIRKYRADYNMHPPVVIFFMSDVASTSGRFHSEFVCLLFYRFIGKLTVFFQEFNLCNMTVPSSTTVT